MTTQSIAYWYRVLHFQIINHLTR